MINKLYYTLVDNDDWRVRIVSPNFEIINSDKNSYNASIRLYTKQRTILEVYMKETSGSNDITISDGYNAAYAPNMTFAEAQVSNGKSTTYIDISQYVRLSEDTIVVSFDDGSVTLNFLTQDGVHPRMLQTQTHNFCNFDSESGDIWITEHLTLYGRLPSMMYRGSVHELNVMFEWWYGYESSGEQSTFVQAATHFMRNDIDVPLVKIIDSANSANNRELLLGEHTISMPSTDNQLQLSQLEVYIPDGYEWWSDTDIPAGGEISHEAYGDKFVLRRGECGIDYAHVKWTSRSGNPLQSLWQVVKKTDNVGDVINLANFTDNYTGKRGFNDGVTIKLDKLTAFDVWYYASIITSDSVQISLRNDDCYVGANVVTKNVVTPDGDNEFYELEIELEVSHYDAI